MCPIPRVNFIDTCPNRLSSHRHVPDFTHLSYRHVPVPHVLSVWACTGFRASPADSFFVPPPSPSYSLFIFLAQRSTCSQRALGVNFRKFFLPLQNTRLFLITFLSPLPPTLSRFSKLFFSPPKHLIVFRNFLSLLPNTWSFINLLLFFLIFFFAFNCTKRFVYIFMFY